MLTPIIILCLLISPWLLTLLVGRWRGGSAHVNLHQAACWGLGLAFLFFSLGHFVKTADMIAMLPPWVPFRYELILLTGVLELVIAVGLFVSVTRRAAAILAIGDFIAFFPANIYSAWNAIGMGGHQWGPIYLWIRAPLQIILMAWAYFLCVRQRSPLTRITAQ